MRRVAMLSVALVVIAGGATASGVATARPPRHAVVDAATSSTATSSEYLRYRATWNGVPVARGELDITPRGADEVTLAGRAQTNEVLDLLWRMRDGFEATIAQHPIAPRRLAMHQHENDRHRETLIVYDAAQRALVGTVRKHGSDPRVATVSTADGNVYDPATMAWLIRARARDLRARETYRVFIGTYTYALSMTPVGDESITVLGRPWRTRKVHLSLQLDELDPKAKVPRVQDADLWISTGPDLLPLRMQGQSYWGWVVMELVGRGPADSHTVARSDPR
jgi:hypothetical protein